MRKLANWNEWCNDKIVLTNTEGHDVVFSPNDVTGIEGNAEGCTVCVTNAWSFDVQESVEDVLKIIGEGVEESKERQKKRAEEQMKAYQDLQQKKEA